MIEDLTKEILSYIMEIAIDRKTSTEAKAVILLKYILPYIGESYRRKKFIVYIDEDYIMELIEKTYKHEDFIDYRNNPFYEISYKIAYKKYNNFLNNLVKNYNTNKPIINKDKKNIFIRVKEYFNSISRYNYREYDKK